MTAERRDRRLMRAILWLGLIVALVELALPGLVVVRTVLGLPYLLAGQGYLLSRAVFARDRLVPSARLLVALAFSVVAIVLVALVLSVLGLAVTPAALTLGLIVLAAVAYVARRRESAPGDGVTRPAAAALSWREHVRRRSPGARWAVGLAVGAAIFTASLVALARPLPNATVAGYTQLWALRSTGSAITVGVTNAQFTRQTYRVRASPAGGAPRSFTVTLAPGASATRRVALSGPPLQLVRVSLYRGTAAGRGARGGPYRSVLLAP